MRQEPAARPPVQLVGQVAVAVAQSRPEQRAEQGVIAVPGRVVGLGDDHPVPLELRQPVRSRRVPGERFCQVAGQPLGHARVQQEPLEPLVLPGEELLEQVVDDRRLGSGHAVDQLPGIGLPLERVGGKAQPCRPPLRAAPDRLALAAGEPNAMNRQQLHGFRGVEGEPIVPDLFQAAVESQARQADGRVGAAAQHDVQAGGRPLDQVRQRVQRLGRGQLLDVVEQEDVAPTRPLDAGERHEPPH
ncbi:MAG TPA: hypothetical protein VE575_02375 [Acidimicrobiales bacterium]|nr:hypothetical protein [Acidimicrobiales bacterium]